MVISVKVPKSILVNVGIICVYSLTQVEYSDKVFEMYSRTALESLIYKIVRAKDIQRKVVTLKLPIHEVFMFQLSIVMFKEDFPEKEIDYLLSYEYFLKPIQLQL